jgi:hypothetical protein
MYSGNSGGTAFVDNGDTGERYIVGFDTYPGWHITAIGSKCIVNQMGTKVCRLW